MIKLKDLLKEELLGEFKGVEIYKNPKSIKRMKPFIRGISDPKGNLYVVDNPFKIIHSELEEWLKRKGYIKDKSNDWLSKNWQIEFSKMVKKGYIYWQRYGSKDTFMLSESTYPGAVWFKEQNLLKYMKKSLSKVKQKNPNYNFILRQISL